VIETRSNGGITRSPIRQVSTLIRSTNDDTQTLIGPRRLHLLLTCISSELCFDEVDAVVCSGVDVRSNALVMPIA
jgi:hypothetical protein